MKMSKNIESNTIEEIIEIIQCPICYLAMTPPLRTPMITPECGHTICLQCITKIKECPFCNHCFSTPLKNILVCQIADSLQKKGLIPEDINPPPASDNKLIPKIKGICTYAITGDKSIWQKSYQCKTCNKSDFCEICANVCHKDHDISLKKDGPCSSCCCGSNQNICFCMPKTHSIKCTAEITYGIPADQPMYQCFDCKITGDNYICQSCAIKCHSNHKLRYIGILKNKLCSCFKNNSCIITQKKPICTFYFTGPNYVKQPWYHCRTCGLVNNLGCCAACAKSCHKNHDVYFVEIHEECYCDCGERGCPICTFPNSHYMTCCTNLDRNHKNEEKQQRMYHCMTCGITGNYAICEACAINCHINHSIEYVGIKKFACLCSPDCQMKSIPLLHNDRSICDRKVLEDDDISPCYTCYTCDPSGNKQICETCALKIHPKHDIHLVGYFSFKCCEEGEFIQDNN